MRLAAAGALALLTLQESARADIFHFVGSRAPPNSTLSALHFFYIYNHHDSPDPQAEAFVKFKGLGFKSASPRKTDDMLKDYHSLQLSIIRLGHFWNVINPASFCCTQQDVEDQRCEMLDQIRYRRAAMKGPMDEVDVYPYTVRHSLDDSEFGIQRDLTKTIRTTGVYALVISNCGSLNRATVTGSVVVKNPFGFLPGIDYYKMPFYLKLCLAYGGLGLIWGLLSVRFWREIFNVQSCIAAVIGLGLVEAFFWYLCYHDWNETGERSWFLFVCGNIFSVARSIFSYVLVLVGSMGWGITRPYLDRAEVQRIGRCCVLYVVLDIANRGVKHKQHMAERVPYIVFFLSAFSMALLYGGIFYWIMTSLTNLIQTLKERRQSDKLALFENLFRVLAVSLVVAVVAQLHQFWMSSRDIEGIWRSAWLYTEGIPHMLFVGVLMAMMFLWAPHKNTQRYAYSAQTDMGDGKMPAVVDAAVKSSWVEDFEVEDDDSFWKAKKGDGEDEDDCELAA